MPPRLTRVLLGLACALPQRQSECQAPRPLAAAAQRPGIPGISELQLAPQSKESLGSKSDDTAPGRRMQQQVACGDADRDGSGTVSVSDLLILLASFGTSAAAGDVNNDSITDVSDLLLLLAHFGCADPGQSSATSTPLPDPDQVLANVRSLSIHGPSTVNRVADGTKIYEDRSFVYQDLPIFLRGCPGIRNRNNDKHEPPSMEIIPSASEFETDFLCFDLLSESSIYILYDATVPHPPTWLTSDFVRLPHRTWLPSDHGSRCDDWLDRWVWTPPEPDYDSSRNPSNRWHYGATQNPYTRCEDLVPPPRYPGDPDRCSDSCNLNHAHGAPCNLEIIWDVLQAGPTCECSGQCPPVIPTCAVSKNHELCI